MFSIGQLSRRTGVKVPTIRYYEDRGLLPQPERSSGNQRRYGDQTLKLLEFIKHTRQLGLPLEDVSELISLQEKSGPALSKAHEIALRQRNLLRERIEELQKLEAEHERISNACRHPHDEAEDAGECAVMNGFSDHGACEHAHKSSVFSGNLPVQTG